MTFCRGPAWWDIRQEECSRQPKSKEVVMTLGWLGRGSDLLPKKMRPRKSSEMSKVSPLGIQLGSWGPFPFLLGEFPEEKTGPFCFQHQAQTFALGCCWEGYLLVITAEKRKEVGPNFLSCSADQLCVLPSCTSIRKVK